MRAVSFSSALWKCGATVSYHYYESGQSKSNVQSAFENTRYNPVTSKTVMWNDENLNQQRSETTSYCIGFGVSGRCPAQAQNSIRNPDGGQTKYVFQSLWAYQGLSDASGNQVVAKITNPDGSTIERVWGQNRQYLKSATGDSSPSPGNPYVQYEIHSVAGGAGPT